MRSQDYPLTQAHLSNPPLFSIPDIPILQYLHNMPITYVNISHSRRNISMHQYSNPSIPSNIPITIFPSLPIFQSPIFQCSNLILSNHLSVLAFVDKITRLSPFSRKALTLLKFDPRYLFHCRLLNKHFDGDFYSDIRIKQSIFLMVQTRLKQN